MPPLMGWRTIITRRLFAPAVQLHLGLDHLASLVVRPTPVRASEDHGHLPLHVGGLAQPRWYDWPIAGGHKKLSAATNRHFEHPWFEHVLELLSKQVVKKVHSADW